MKKYIDAQLFKKMLGMGAAPVVAQKSAFGEEYFSENGKLEWEVEVLKPFVVTTLNKTPADLAVGTYTLSLIQQDVSKKSVAMLKVVGASLFAPIPYWRSNVLKGNIRIIK